MNSKFWLNELKIAIVNEDDKKALSLIENLPNFDSIQDLICAREITKNFIDKLQNEKNKLKQNMLKLKQIKIFLEA